MQKISTAQAKKRKVFRASQLTVGLDLGDRSSFYCVLDDKGEVILERRLATIPKVIHQAFGRMARSRIALETGVHSPWVSRPPAN
jgi:transposase